MFSTNSTRARQSALNSRDWPANCIANRTLDVRNFSKILIPDCSWMRFCKILGSRFSKKLFMSDVTCTKIQMSKREKASRGSIDHQNITSSTNHRSLSLASWRESGKGNNQTTKSAITGLIK